MSRITRKDEHILSALKLEPRPMESGFGDITLVHNALPEISEHEVSLDSMLLGRQISAPIIINAITGGGSVPAKINEALAVAARETGLAMAVGSQSVALERPEAEISFRIVRKVNPDGMVLANVGAHVGPEYALRAIDMINADALQVHLNVPQEAAMKEGDRDFRGWTANIASLVHICPVPVIIKEVGFGISREVAQRLHAVGVEHFDVGGRGGTNFISIECIRNDGRQRALETWGIPTAASLIEIESSDLAATIMATGGLASGLDAAKALALGANAAGIAGAYLKALFEGNTDGLIRRIENMKADLKKVLLMLGVKRPREMKKVPVVISGKTREWLTERGIETSRFSCRPWPV